MGGGAFINLGLMKLLRKYVAKKSYSVKSHENGAKNQITLSVYTIDHNPQSKEQAVFAIQFRDIFERLIVSRTVQTTFKF